MHVLQRTIAVEAKIKKIRIENVLTKLKKFWNIWWFSCTHLVCRERLLLCFVSFVGRAERAWTVDSVKEYYNFLKVRFATYDNEHAYCTRTHKIIDERLWTVDPRSWWLIVLPLLTGYGIQHTAPAVFRDPLEMEHRLEFQFYCQVFNNQ